MARLFRDNRQRQASPAAAAAVAVLMVLLAVCLPATAQDDDEYRMEIGVTAGLMSYQGDLGGHPLQDEQLLAGAVAKYKPNPRMAWTARLARGKLKGSSANAKTWLPELHANPVSFATSLTTLDIAYEYNFWAYGTGREYLGARPLTPFISLGLGLLFTDTPKMAWGAYDEMVPDIERTVDHNPGSTVALEMPLGFGVKYKLGDRLNLTAEWKMHFTGSDKLDGLKDPYGIKSSGMFKNTDCYSSLQVSLTYDIWAKCKTCHNDRD